MIEKGKRNNDDRYYRGLDPTTIVGPEQFPICHACGRGVSIAGELDDNRLCEWCKARGAMPQTRYLTAQKSYNEQRRND